MSTLNQFTEIDLEVGLFLGNPTQGGLECCGAGYARAFFGEPVVALFGPTWGVCNRWPISFPQADESWKCTHIGIFARHFEIFLSCGPISDTVLLLDPVISALGGTEMKIVPVGHTVILQPGSIFILGGIVGQVLDLSNQSKMMS